MNLDDRDDVQDFEIVDDFIETDDQISQIIEDWGRLDYYVPRTAREAHYDRYFEACGLSDPEYVESVVALCTEGFQICAGDECIEPDLTWVEEMRFDTSSFIHAMRKGVFYVKCKEGYVRIGGVATAGITMIGDAYVPVPRGMNSPGDMWATGGACPAVTVFDMNGDGIFTVTTTNKVRVIPPTEPYVTTAGAERSNMTGAAVSRAWLGSRGGKAENLNLYGCKNDEHHHYDLCTYEMSKQSTSSKAMQIAVIRNFLKTGIISATEDDLVMMFFLKYGLQIGIFICIDGVWSLDHGSARSRYAINARAMFHILLSVSEVTPFSKLGVVFLVWGLQRDTRQIGVTKGMQVYNVGKDHTPKLFANMFVTKPVLEAPKDYGVGSHVTKIFSLVLTTGRVALVRDKIYYAAVHGEWCLSPDRDYVWIARRRSDGGKYWACEKHFCYYGFVDSSYRMRNAIQNEAGSDEFTRASFTNYRNLMNAAKVVRTPSDMNLAKYQIGVPFMEGMTCRMKYFPSVDRDGHPVVLDDNQKWLNSRDMKKYNVITDFNDPNSQSHCKFNDKEPYVPWPGMRLIPITARQAELY